MSRRHGATYLEVKRCRGTPRDRDRDGQKPVGSWSQDAQAGGETGRQYLRPRGWITCPQWLHLISGSGAKCLSPLKEVLQDQPEPAFIQGLYDKGSDCPVIGVDVKGSEEEETTEAEAGVRE